MNSNYCLLSYSQETALGPDAIRRTMGVLSKEISILKISSIYKRYDSNLNEDLNSELIFVIKAVTDLDLGRLSRKLALIASWNTKAEILLLAYGQLVQLLPDLTLPHPRLSQESAILRCASEVWGDFNHPVLDQSLYDLVKAVHSFEHVEFFSQGDSFL